MSTTSYMAFISPNGSTRVVADVLASALRVAGREVKMPDLAALSGQGQFLEALASDPRPGLLAG